MPAGTFQSIIVCAADGTVDTAFSTQINVPRPQHRIIILLINIEQRD